jgi:hypothetical protein
MSSDERNLIKNPANGLIIYNITLNGIEVIGTKSTPNWVLVGNNGVTVSPINKLASGATLVGNSDGNAKEVLSGEAVLSNTE